MSSQSDLKQTLLSALVSASALTFGTYTLKSGRISPYFFTSSLLHTSSLLGAVARAYAAVLTSPPFTATTSSSSSSSTAISQTEPVYDILFGPAYKGIPLAALVTRELELTPTYSANKQAFGNVSYSFNRKEAKDHGEGGTIVGAPLKGKRVVIIDDVMTAGTALREAVSIIQAQGGKVAGVVLLLTRSERVSDTEARSAMKVAEDELNVPVRAVLSFDDIIEVVKSGRLPGAGEEQAEAMRVYRERYGSSD